MPHAAKAMAAWLVVVLAVGARGVWSEAAAAAVTPAVECPTSGSVRLVPSHHDNGFGHDDHEGDAGHEIKRYHVASVDFSHVQTPFIIALWIFLATLAKIGFHMANKLSSMFPESCLLIVVGVIIGLLLFYTRLTTVSPLTPATFFLYMLPPIVLDAGYFMPNRLFFDNLGSILLFAVVGTLWNTSTIGLALWAVGQTGLYQVELSLLETFLFSALISAVDPVAVLAVFEEIQVNEVLYIVVFGESLLNDAVTVVLYHMFEAYTEMGISNILYTDVLSGVASFFVVAIGGTAIGVFWGYLTAFVTRFTNHVRVIEPIFVFVMSYMSYLNAEMFHLSGILAITFCGISMKNYVEANISHKSHTTVKYTMKMIASSAETIIFMFLGVATVTDDHVWNTWFVVFTILFCTVFRAIGVVVLTYFANHFRVQKLNKVEEFVMAYGGLRGAVAFALALTISENVVAHKHMFVTTTIAVVYFTVFIQGITIKPLVNILGVKKSEKRKVNMNERIHERFIDHLMAGIEDVIGHHGNHHLRDKFKYYDNKYIRRWFVRDHRINDPKILETFSKLNLKDAMTMVHQSNLYLPRIGTAEFSLGNLFRSYTTSNLATRPGSEKNTSNLLAVPAEISHSQGSLSRENSSAWNLDMKEFNYSPSGKDLGDASLHHILSDAMFKPVRRHRKYSRSQIHEPDIHPPFHHKMRMQIRHVLSEQNKTKGRMRGEKKKNGHVPANKSTVQNGNARIPQYVVSYPEDEGIIFAAQPLQEDDEVFTTAGNSRGVPSMIPVSINLRPNHLPIIGAGYVPRPLTFPSPPSWMHPNHFRFPDAVREGNYKDRQRSSGRIKFDADRVDETTRKTAATHTIPSRAPSPPLVLQLTEQLPWKRLEEDGADGGEPVRQQEFPSWIDNKEYTAYMSPTSTFLGGMESPPIRTPVFDTFERLEDVKEASGEEDEEEPDAHTIIDIGDVEIRPPPTSLEGSSTAATKVTKL